MILIAMTALALVALVLVTPVRQEIRIPVRTDRRRTLR